VLAELRRSGLLGDTSEKYQLPPMRRNDHPDEAARTARALVVWHESQPAAGTIVETYLANRGFPLLPLQCLRFHPDCPHPSSRPHPAMVALVDHSRRGPAGVHRTYLQPDGSGKASVEPAKASLGSVGGGAVRFGMPRTHERLAVAEGIETALSVAVACAMPAWAALSAGGIRALVLPHEATHVVICADHDASGIGQRAAEDAAQRWLAEGRHVRIAMPPEPDTDMADVLLGHVYAVRNEAHHVA
jgi:phage/plasmid primase-like uncharacterized protein